MKIDITENLYQKKDFIWGEGQSAFYDLLNVVNKGILDKNYNAMKSFALYYPQYKDFEIISGSDGYNLENDGLNISGDVLNSFKNVFKRYIKDSSSGINFGGTAEEWGSIFIENQDLLSQNKCVKQIHFKKAKINISEKANLYFHLTTTVGNISPWILGGNYPCGSGLDIVKNKFPWFYGVIDDKRTNVKYYAPIKKWKEFIIKKNDNKNFSNWKQAFIDMHYLQDFVDEDGMTPKYVLSTEKLSVEDGSWDNFFFETSKAIISRSYRVLNGIKGDFSENQLKEIKESFNALCAEYEVKERW